jgi:hypothetical protein
VGAAKARKQAGKEERRAKVAAIREAVFAVWDGNCALCLCGRQVTVGGHATDLHHLISGSGNRRRYEAVGTVLPVCEEHHRRLHRNDEETLESVVEVLGDPDCEMEPAAIRAVERRLAKVHATRGSAARAERERSGA